MKQSSVHQYIERTSRQVVTEALVADQTVNLIYSDIRENAPFLFDLMISKRFSALLGAVTYDTPLGKYPGNQRRLLKSQGINLDEALDRPEDLNSYRKIFERKIRFWETRPMVKDPRTLVSPADAAMLVGSFSTGSPLFIKEKFFDYADLIGPDKPRWHKAFLNGEYAVFRLTPEKYHYNHAPVAGLVKDVYGIDGKFHSCNPGAVVKAVTPYSKNRRVVTIIDTDVPGGSGMGLVAMVEVVALMIGQIVQCYSRERYDDPVPVSPELFIKKGQPKSLFRPGSSTTILMFQKNRIGFSRDIMENMARTDVVSRFSKGFGRQIVETAVWVRSPIGHACPAEY